MKYCELTTKGHPLSVRNSSCLEPITNIIRREGGRSSSFTNAQVALNLDAVERNSRPAQPRATMDCTFGIANRRRSTAMVLIDLKCNHKISPKHITRTDLQSKVAGSISILDWYVKIFPEYYFIFSDNLKEQARSHFRLIFLGKPRINYIPLTIQELYNKFF
jgi:hypothetical protein